LARYLLSATMQPLHKTAIMRMLKKKYAVLFIKSSLLN
jgi:hypothetical protein